MKKVLLAPLFLFLLACENTPIENKELSNETKERSNSNVPPDYTADSTKKWSRNLNRTIFTMENTSDTLNYTDANHLKQGKWLIFDISGKVIKTEFYKDGKVVTNC